MVIKFILLIIFGGVILFIIPHIILSIIIKLNNKQEIKKMNFYNYYTKTQINDICWYYGQFMYNLNYNQIALLIEKYEIETK